MRFSPITVTPPTAPPGTHGKTRERIEKITANLLLTFAALVFVFPLWWMATTSVKPFEEAVQAPPTLIPALEQPEGADQMSLGARVGYTLSQIFSARYWTEQIRWENYRRTTTEAIDFWLQLKNTLLLCILNVVGTVCSCALVAYGFSRIEWPGREKVFAITLATMMIPGPVLLIPLYQLYRDLGWLGSFKPLYMPAFFASAYNIFLMRQFFRGIPKDLTEAARIDGCSEWRIFWQIVLPLSKPVLIVIALFSFLYVWNDFIGPLIYLTEPDQYTLALGLNSYVRAMGGTEIHLLMAAASLMILPVIFLFLIAQRYFIEGISLTGLKG